MNEHMQTLFSSALASAILWASLAGWSSAHATANPPSPRPPGYTASTTIGPQIMAAENGIIPWQKSALGELADYNSYTKKREDDAFVNSVIEECMNSGNKTKQCIFGGGKTGMDLLISSLLGSYAFDDTDSSKPTHRNLAVKYIKNMTFFMPDYPGDATVFKDKDKKDKLTSDGYSYFAQIFRQLPMISVAQNAMLAMVAERTRLAGLSAGLPVGVNNSASIMEMLRYEAMRRYADPKWFSNLSDPNVSTDRAIMAEIAYLLAFQNYMMVKTYEQNAQTQALLVAQLSGMNGMMAQVSASSSPAKQKEIQKQADKNK
jgi:hypothetical protein